MAEVNQERMKEVFYTILTMRQRKSKKNVTVNLARGVIETYQRGLSVRKGWEFYSFENRNLFIREVVS